MFKLFSFFGKKIDENTLEELSDTLITSDFGSQATKEIIAQLKNQKNSDLKEALSQQILNIIKKVEQPFHIGKDKPFVVLMVGVNGAGKTTSIGKLAHILISEQKLKVSLVAADTFRAGAVEQLKVWGEKNNVKVYSSQTSTDAAALCFDSLKQAINNGDDVVLIDTAGRLQNKNSLMEELQKIIRVIKKVLPDAPHHTLITIDATTGQNAVDQIKTFSELTNVSGIIVSKLDSTAKAGFLVSHAQSSDIPVFFVGTGEGIEDFSEFNAKSFVERIMES